MFCPNDKVMLKRAAEGVVVRYGEGAAKLETANLSRSHPNCSQGADLPFSLADQDG